MMYEKLCRRLRAMADTWGISLPKEAADAIEELQKNLERTKDFEAFWQHEAEDALRKYQVAVANKPQWIPVMERLPDSCGHYFVFIIGGAFWQISWETTAFFDGKIFRWEHMGQEHPEDVTHWMPLPDPPKGE